MKQVILIVASIFVSSFTFANLNNHSSLQNQLHSALKAKPVAEPALNANDILMGYAGQDISRRPTLATHTTVV